MRVLLITGGSGASLADEDCNAFSWFNTVSFELALDLELGSLIISILLDSNKLLTIDIHVAKQ